MQGEGNQEGVKIESEEEEENKPPPSKQSKKSFLLKKMQPHRRSMESRAEREIQTYMETPPTITSSDPVAWFWTLKQTYPLMSCLAFSYLCVQASSTPCERVFSTAGNTICAERSHLLPEKADKIIFLNINCFWFVMITSIWVCFILFHMHPSELQLFVFLDCWCYFSRIQFQSYS